MFTRYSAEMYLGFLRHVLHGKLRIKNALVSGNSFRYFLKNVSSFCLRNIFYIHVHGKR